jgi:hypothetical protein
MHCLSLPPACSYFPDQFVNYYTLYHDDKRSFKWIVGILLLATTLKSVQAL